MKSVLKKIIFIFPMAILALSSCMDDEKSNYLSYSDFLIVKETFPTLTCASWAGVDLTIPQLNAEMFNPGNCLIASFKIDYDNQPAEAEGYTVTELYDAQKIERYYAMEASYSDSICASPERIEVAPFGDDGTIAFFSDVLFGGVVNNEDAAKHLRYQFSWTESSIEEQIPVLYVSATGTEDKIGSIFAADLGSFISACSNKIQNKKLSFYIKYYSGEKDGVREFSLVSSTPCSIVVEK